MPSCRYPEAPGAAHSVGIHFSRHRSGPLGAESLELLLPAAAAADEENNAKPDHWNKHTGVARSGSARDSRSAIGKELEK